MTPHVSFSRALQRRITSPRDSVWISDSLLAATFERFCLVSKTWHRRVGHVPGPLESRRRLGKRQMADLNSFPCAASPPGWAFPVYMDLSKWQWEPPSFRLTPSQQNLPRAQVHTSTTWLPSALSGWLGEASPRVDKIPPPFPDPDAPAHAAVKQYAQFHVDLDAFCSSVATASADALGINTQAFCRRFQQEIYLGQLQPEDVVLISSRIWDALDLKYENAPFCGRPYLSLYTAIVAGATTSKVFSPTLLATSFWDALLVRMSSLPISDESCGLFVEVMDAIPRPGLQDISEGLLRMLGGFFCTWSSAPDSSSDGVQWTLHTSHHRHIKTISEALKAVSPQEDAWLLDEAEELLHHQRTISGTNQRELLYNWLCVLAQLPQVNQAFLFDTSARFTSVAIAEGIMPMAGTELSSLLLCQWESRGYVRTHRAKADFLRRKYEKICLQDDDKAIASLLLAIYFTVPEQEWWGLFASFWTFFGKLGRSHDVFESLATLSQSRRVPKRLLEQLAFRSQNHRIAIDLHNLYMWRVRIPGGPEWDPRATEWCVDRIVLDPSLSPAAVWGALDIDTVRGSVDPKKARARHLGTFGARRAAIVKRVATLLSHASHLRNRVAFRHVSHCVRFLESVEGKLSPTVAKALYRVVSKDLDQGEPGRTSRLLWFIRVVYRNYGLNTANRCHVALVDWRARMWNIRGGGARHGRHRK
ncbi:hypothetical protein B0H63DRAFT_35029 [Podospora didyma]|uniref:Uncharacterized protein n=1 Tax=Podospora didyma TaxID=330526 RepID=A0AAE0P698_9PEZI|nr:hypothetical protein B0H63DRAFT_35029 [Podospora didyma]